VNLAVLGSLGLGAGIAALIAGWQQVQGLLTRLVGILVVTAEFRGWAAEEVAFPFPPVLGRNPPHSPPLEAWLGSVRRTG